MKEKVNMSQRKSLVFLFVAAVCFSLGGLCIKMIPWNSFSINAFRSIFAAIILFAFMKIVHMPMKLTKSVVIGACAVCVDTTGYAVANKLTTAANTILIEYTAPVFVIIFMFLVYKERPKKTDVLACALVFCGILCFFLDSLGNGRIAGDLLALLSGITYAWVFMMNKMPGANPMFSCFLGQVFGAIIGLPFLVQETDFSATTMGWAIILAVFQFSVAYLCMSIGIIYAPPIAASLVMGIEPILNPILVAIVVGETLSGLAIVGAVLVFVTIMTYNLRSAKQEKTLKEAD